jgi:hypothetical protein
LNNALVRTNKHTYELTYTVEGKIYRILLRVKRGPKKLIYAYDQDSNDITENLQMYLGPNDDFHHGTFTPDYFNKESITVHLADGDEKVFTRFQPIFV